MTDQCEQVKINPPTVAYPQPQQTMDAPHLKHLHTTPHHSTPDGHIDMRQTNTANSNAKQWNPSCGQRGFGTSTVNPNRTTVLMPDPSPTTHDGAPTTPHNRATPTSKDKPSFTPQGGARPNQ